MTQQAINGEKWRMLQAMERMKMQNDAQKRIAKAYAGLQFIIWAKSVAFFALYGHGKVMIFSSQAFPPEARLFDFIFHETCHVLIGIMALAYGKNMGNPRALEFVATIFAAVALHNAMYWLTASHPNLLYSAKDFAGDFIILGAFVVAGAMLARNEKIRAVKLPFLEK
ncbi:Uncharacterised protein [uncultured archaeon]|nr:Uncharacterised protein [uncultured archaeon]